MYRLAEAERADNVHTETSESVVQVGAFRSFTRPLECRAKRLGLLSK